MVRFNCEAILKYIFTALLLVTFCFHRAAAQKAPSKAEKDVDAFLTINAKTDFSKIIINDSLAKENKKLKKAIDSLYNEAYYKAREADKEQQAIKDNLALYTFITQYKRDSLLSLTKRFPDYITFIHDTLTLTLKEKVNLETVQQLVGNTNLKQQFPALYRDLDERRMNVMMTVVNENVGMGAGSPGMRVPDIPVLTITNSDTDAGYKKLYNDYNQWMVAYIQATHCDMGYMDIFAKTELKKLGPGATWKKRMEFRRCLVDFLKTKCF